MDGPLLELVNLGPGVGLEEVELVEDDEEAGGGGDLGEEEALRRLRLHPLHRVHHEHHHVDDLGPAWPNLPRSLPDSTAPGPGTDDGAEEGGVARAVHEGELDGLEGGEVGQATRELLVHGEGEAGEAQVQRDAPLLALNVPSRLGLGLGGRLRGGGTCGFLSKAAVEEVVERALDKLVFPLSTWPRIPRLMFSTFPISATLKVCMPC